MKKLFTVDDFIVAGILGIGYGLDFSVFGRSGTFGICVQYGFTSVLYQKNLQTLQ